MSAFRARRPLFLARYSQGSQCKVLSLISWLSCVVLHVTLIVMLRVSDLCPCGVLLCVVHTLSGQCAVLSTCIVIVTYRVL